MMNYCVDERHEEPCHLPCPSCEEECDSRAVEQIPALWVKGFLQGKPEATVQDAVDHWMEQVALERQYEQQKREAVED